MPRSEPANKPVNQLSARPPTTRFSAQVGAFILTLACATGLLVGGPDQANAQVVEEIVVTARKVEENLQDVPLSIAAFTGEQMREIGIRNNYDVAALTPNFNTVQRVGRAGDRPVIRGMSNPPDPNQAEPNASYFIDGIFVSSTIATATTFAMERVEVLRGPQSAQFGRATFAGAVNYVTRKPTNDLELEANARYGTNDERQLAGWLSGPILRDRLLFLLSASHEQYGGQWSNNLQPDTAFVNGTIATNVFGDQSREGDTSKLGEEETTDVLAKLTWSPAASTEIDLKYGYTKGDDSLYPTNVLPNTTSDFANLNCFIPDDPAEPWYETSRGEFCGEFTDELTENRKNLPDQRNGMTAEFTLIGQLPPEKLTAAPAKPGLRRETQRFLGEWNQGFGEWNAVLRGAFNDDEFSNVIDLDQQEVRAVWNLFLLDIEEEIEDTAAELIFSSPADRTVRGTLGGYWFDRDQSRIERSFTGPAAVFGVEPGAGFGEPLLGTTRNVSVFGSIAVDLAPNWTLSLEARYADDEKTISSGQRSLADNSPAPVNASLNFTAFTPRVTLDWRPTDDMLVYTLVAKGNKPGGFNNDLFRSDVPAEFSDFLVNCEIGDELLIPGAGRYQCTEEFKADATFKEEEQWTYEAGLKSAWLGQSVIANLAVFYIDWTNQALTELAEVPTSSGNVINQQVLRNVGRSKITGFELESSWVANENLSLFFNYGLADGEIVEGALPNFGATTGTDGDVSGHRIPDTPKHSVVFGFEASANAGKANRAFLRGDFIYEDRRYNNASNLNWVGDRRLVNLRTGLQANNWALTLYVRNLLDDDTPIAALGFNNYAINPISTAMGAPNDGAYPRLYSIIPQRGRDVGIEFQYRVGP